MTQHGQESEFIPNIETVLHENGSQVIEHTNKEDKIEREKMEDQCRKLRSKNIALDKEVRIVTLALKRSEEEKVEIERDLKNQIESTQDVLKENEALMESLRLKANIEKELEGEKEKKLIKIKVELDLRKEIRELKSNWKKLIKLLVNIDKRSLK